jgi:hypothetical protein
MQAFATSAGKGEAGEDVSHGAHCSQRNALMISLALRAHGEEGT